MRESVVVVVVVVVSVFAVGALQVKEKKRLQYNTIQCIQLIDDRIHIITLYIYMQNPI